MNHVDVPYVIVRRRPGDIAACYADPSKAKRLLRWQAEKTLEDMCRDSLALADPEPQRLSGLNTAPRRAHAFRGIFCPPRRLQQDLTARGNFLFHKNML